MRSSYFEIEGEGKVHSGSKLNREVFCIGDYVFLRPVKHTGENDPFLQAHGALCDRVWTNLSTLDVVDSSVFQICYRTRVHAAEQLVSFEEKQKKLRSPEDREHAIVQRGILQRVCKKEEEVNKQQMQKMMGTSVKYGEAIQLRHRLSGKYLQSGQTSGNLTEEDASHFVAITEPEHFAAFLSDVPSQATWFVILSSDLIPTEVVTKNSHVYLQVAKQQEFLSVGSPEYTHPNPLMHGTFEQLESEKTAMHEATMTKAKTTWQLSLFNTYSMAQTASVSFGDMLNLRDTRTKSCLTLAAKDVENDSVGFTFEPIINVQNLPHASAYFIVERAQPRDDFVGGEVRMEGDTIDEVTLRHFNSACYLRVDHASHKFCLTGVAEGGTKAGVFKLHSMPSDGVAEVYVHLSMTDTARDGGGERCFLDVDVEKNTVKLDTQTNASALFLHVETRSKQMALFTSVSILRQLKQFRQQFTRAFELGEEDRSRKLSPFIVGCTKTLAALDQFVVMDELIQTGDFRTRVSGAKQRLLREQGVLHELLKIIEKVQPYWSAQQSAEGGEGGDQTRKINIRIAAKAKALKGIGKVKKAVAALSRVEAYAQQVAMEREQMQIILREEEEKKKQLVESRLHLEAFKGAARHGAARYASAAGDTQSRSVGKAALMAVGALTRGSGKEPGLTDEVEGVLREAEKAAEGGADNSDEDPLKVLLRMLFGSLQLLMLDSTENQLSVAAEFKMLLGCIPFGDQVIRLIHCMLTSREVQESVFAKRDPFNGLIGTTTTAGRVATTGVNTTLDVVWELIDTSDSQLSTTLLQLCSVFCLCQDVAVQENQIALGEKIVARRSLVQVELRQEARTRSGGGVSGSRELQEEVVFQQVVFIFPATKDEKPQELMVLSKEQEEYLAAQTILFAKVCVQRNYLNIAKVRAWIKMEAALLCMANKKLSKELRAAFAMVLHAVYIDVEPLLPQRWQDRCVIHNEKADDVDGYTTSMRGDSVVSGWLGEVANRATDLVQPMVNTATDLAMSASAVAADAVQAIGGPQVSLLKVEGGLEFVDSHANDLVELDVETLKGKIDPKFDEHICTLQTMLFEDLQEPGYSKLSTELSSIVHSLVNFGVYNIDRPGKGGTPDRSCSLRSLLVILSNSMTAEWAGNLSVASVAMLQARMSPTKSEGTPKIFPAVPDVNTDGGGGTSPAKKKKRRTSRIGNLEGMIRGKSPPPFRSAASFMRKSSEQSVRTIEQAPSPTSSSATGVDPKKRFPAVNSRKKMLRFLDNKYTMLSIIGLVIAALISTQVAEFTGSTHLFFRGFDLACYAVFAVELLLRMWAMGNIYNFLHNPFCVIDLMVVAIDTVWFAFEDELSGNSKKAQYSKILRLFRLVRLLRLLKLMRLLGVLKRAWELNRKAAQWFLPMEYTRQDTKNLEAMTASAKTMCLVIAHAGKVKLRSLVSELTNAQYVLKDGEIEVDVLRGWGVDEAQLSTTVMHLLLYEHAPLNQAAIQLLMSIHTAHDSLVASARAVHFLCLPKDKEVYIKLEEEMSQITLMMDKLEIYVHEDDAGRKVFTDTIKRLLTYCTNSCQAYSIGWSLGSVHKYEKNVEGQTMLQVGIVHST
jgi:hypothetical protein